MLYMAVGITNLILITDDMGNLISVYPYLEHNILKTERLTQNIHMANYLAIKNGKLFSYMLLFWSFIKQKRVLYNLFFLSSICKHANSASVWFCPLIPFPGLLCFCCKSKRSIDPELILCHTNHSCELRPVLWLSQFCLRNLCKYILFRSWLTSYVTENVCIPVFAHMWQIPDSSVQIKKFHFSRITWKLVALKVSVHTDLLVMLMTDIQLNVTMRSAALVRHNVNIFKFFWLTFWQTQV